ncbi:MAG: hypothetical protein IPN01_28660 [Deltaproteobacteria bacterium]|nr:hypothetical protein [Deltaproteobacteria bacterium]
MTITTDTRPSPNLPDVQRTVTLLLGSGRKPERGVSIKLQGEGPSASDIVIEDRG